MGTMGIVILGIIAVIALWAISAYNGLIKSRVQVENSWSQIDVQLKRRYDLIPNLIETVKGYASHEKQTLEDVVNARSQAMGGAGKSEAERAGLENMLTGALKSLFALSEAYPDLKANQNFQSLQEELTSTENRIGFARQHYNDSVSVYRTARQTFPSNIIASSFGFKERDFFVLDEAEADAAKSPPQVKF